tara:strand:- start:49 stop:405 length:357 start_codon:yes stop_codon:yes gene_type:complete
MAEKKFKSHMMYKKCKGVMVKTMEQHLKLKKKGYNEKLDKACKTKGSPSKLTDAQKTLPDFIQKAILAKENKEAKDSAGKMTGPGPKGKKPVGPFSKHNMQGKRPPKPKRNEDKEKNK